MDNQPVPNSVPEPTLTSAQVPVSETKSKFSLVVPVLLVILVLLLGSTAFLYYQNQQLKSILASYQTSAILPTPSATADPTANWKTYTNTAGKYLFKYPGDYKINENKIVGVDGVSSPASNTTQVISTVIKGTNGNFAVTITHKNTTSDLQTFIGSNSSCSSVIPENGTNYKVDTANGLIFRDTPCGPRGATYLYFINNGIGYVVAIESTVDSNTTKLYFDQILSTFKFTQ